MKYRKLEGGGRTGSVDSVPEPVGVQLKRDLMGKPYDEQAEILRPPKPLVLDQVQKSTDPLSTEPLPKPAVGEPMVELPVAHPAAVSLQRDDVRRVSDDTKKITTNVVLGGRRLCGDNCIQSQLRAAHH